MPPFVCAASVSNAVLARTMENFSPPVKMRLRYQKTCARFRRLSTLSGVVNKRALRFTRNTIRVSRVSIQHLSMQLDQVHTNETFIFKSSGRPSDRLTTKRPLRFGRLKTNEKNKKNAAIKFGGENIAK